MKFLKALTFLAVLIVGYYGLFKYKLPTVCDTTQTYRIGAIDPRFNLTEAELRADIEDATDVWSNIAKRPLFAYDPNGKIVVNLVYDERQSLSSEIQQTGEAAKADKSNIDTQMAQYEARAASFEERLAALNGTIQDWNAKGGAPEEEYQKIKAEEEALTQEAAELNAIASSLNLDVEDYNSKVNKLNQTGDVLESVLEAKPEAGLYDPRNSKIDIYFNTSRNELIHTLEHEFGHALSLGHVTDPNAIMYSKSSEIVTPAPQDRMELNKACTPLTPYERLLKLQADLATN